MQCDENRPTCRKCFMRGEDCIFESVDDGEGRQPQATHVNRKATSKPAYGFPVMTYPDQVANIGHFGRSTGELMSLRLMHHFEHFTSDTLIFGKPFWRDQILPLALHVSNMSA